MNTKRVNLTQALADDTPAAPIAPAVAAPTEAKYTAPSRKGLKTICGHFDPVVHHELSLLCLTEGKTKQALLAEALNELFKKYGKPRIA